MSNRVTLTDLVTAGFLSPGDVVYFKWPRGGRKYEASIIATETGYEFSYSSKNAIIRTPRPGTLIKDVAISENLENVGALAYGRNWQCLFRKSDGKNLKGLRDDYVSRIKEESGIHSIGISVEGVEVNTQEDSDLDQVLKGLARLRIGKDEAIIKPYVEPPLAEKKGFLNGRISSNGEFHGTAYAYTTKFASPEDANDDPNLVIGSIAERGVVSCYHVVQTRTPLQCCLPFQSETEPGTHCTTLKSDPVSDMALMKFQSLLLPPVLDSLTSLDGAKFPKNALGRQSYPSEKNLSVKPESKEDPWFGGSPGSHSDHLPNLQSIV